MFVDARPPLPIPPPRSCARVTALLALAACCTRTEAVPVTSARRIVQAEALGWMSTNEAESGSSVVTSLPDVSELTLDFEGWRLWFIGAARHVIRWIPRDCVAIFYQSDIRMRGVWVDKSYLVMRAMEEEGASLVWHKIVCRKPPGTIALGRPSYSHMLCVSREPRELPKKPGPDVLPDAGFAPWSRAMGVLACRVACRWLREETNTRTVVDPFCGRGTVLAVANAMGFDAIGVDLSAKRCRAARVLSLDEPGTQRGPASDPLTRGARLFDDGAFFEAHEVWEERWRVERDETKRIFLQGLIQVAAAFHKLFVTRSSESALRLLGRGLAKLDACPEHVDGVDLATFRAELHDCARAISDGRLEPTAVPKMARHEPVDREPR